MIRKTSTIVRLLCLVTVLSAIAGASSATELEARVDRNQLAVGETLQLTLRLHDGSEAPDLAPLASDFAVLDVRQGVRTQIINGRRSSSLDWQLTLAPLRSGSLEIPALQAGSARSAALPVRVLEPGEATAHSAADAAAAPVLIEAEVDDPSPYVQGQVALTVRVLMDERVQRGALSEPSVDGAAVERVGEDRNYSDTRHGRPYQVVERQYAVFPQRSGELVIPPVVFDGSVREPTRRGRGLRHDPFAVFDSMLGGKPFDDAFFNGFAQRGAMPGGSMLDEFFGRGGRPLRTASAPLTLDVQPRPEMAGNDWFLPARSVELVEQWEDPSPVFRVGEPLERTVAIRATGLSGAQLPNLELPPIEGMKQYAEAPVDDTATRGDEVVAIKLQKAALVPTKPGPLTLPAIELAWWDTEHDVSRTATLPARTIDVLPAHGPLAATTPVAPAPPGRPPEASSSAPSIDGEALFAQPLVATEQIGWFTAAAFGLAALVAFGAVRLWGRRPSDPNTAAATAREPSESLSQLERSLRKACDASDPGAALAALQRIARARWPQSPPSGAAGWRDQLGSPALEEAIRSAERARYAPDAPTAAWAGNELWQTYRRASKDVGRAPTNAPILPDLYPTGAAGAPAAPNAG